MSKVALDKMIAYMRGDLEFPTLPEALAVDAAIVEVLTSVQAAQTAQVAEQPKPLRPFNEDAIGFAIRLLVECEREVAELTPLTEFEGVSEEARERFKSELKVKESELAWIKRELRELYDLKLLHLRARIMDYERERKEHTMDAFYNAQMDELIRGINVNIEKVKTAMSKL